MAKRSRGGPAPLTVPLIVFVVLSIAAIGAFMVVLIEYSALSKNIEGLHDSRLCDEKDGKCYFQTYFEKNLTEQTGYKQLLESEYKDKEDKQKQLLDWQDFVGWTDTLTNLKDADPELAAHLTDIKTDATLVDTPNVLSYVYELKRKSADLDSALSDCQRARDDAITKRDDIRRQRVLDLDAKQELIRKRDDRIATLINSIKEQEQALAAEIQKLKAEAAAAKREVTLLKDESQRKIRNLVEKNNENEQKITDMRRKLQEEERFDPNKASVDGKILYADERGKFVMIDMGRVDGITRGLKFTVYQIGKGGTRREKGEVEVNRVMTEFSYASILELKDDKDPMVEGDSLVNPAFDRDRSTVFVLTGEFEKMSNDRIQRILKSYGATITNKVTLKTDYLVAGPGSDPEGEMKTARELGVKIMSEEDLLKYLGRTGD